MKSNLKSLPTITEHEIRNLMNMRQTERHYKDRINLIQESIRLVEQNLIAKIEQGANEACGPYCLRIRETSRRCPAWKEFFIRVAGSTAAEEVIAETEAKTHQALIVEVA